MSISTTDEQANEILVVEDDEDSRRAMTAALENQGYRVTALDSCEAALAYLKASPRPRVIVLDLRMPGMEGWDFRRLQKQDPELARIPVISVSAQGKLVDVDVALHKPVDYDELMRAVGRFVTTKPKG